MVVFPSRTRSIAMRKARLDRTLGGSDNDLGKSLRNLKIAGCFMAGTLILEAMQVLRMMGIL